MLGVYPPPPPHSGSGMQKGMPVVAMGPGFPHPPPPNAGYFSFMPAPFPQQPPPPPQTMMTHTHAPPGVYQHQAHPPSDSLPPPMHAQQYQPLPQQSSSSSGYHPQFPPPHPLHPHPSHHPPPSAYLVPPSSLPASAIPVAAASSSSHTEPLSPHTSSSPFRRRSRSRSRSPVRGAGSGSASHHQISAKRKEQHRLEYAKHMKNFWQKQKDLIEKTDYKRLKHDLPLARIKKIMKTDDDVRMISAEVPILFSKACELFVLDLTMRAWAHTADTNRRTLQRSDVSDAITEGEGMDFLVDIVPREDENTVNSGTQSGAGTPSNSTIINNNSSSSSSTAATSLLTAAQRESGAVILPSPASHYEHDDKLTTDKLLRLIKDNAAGTEQRTAVAPIVPARAQAPDAPTAAAVQREPERAHKQLEESTHDSGAGVGY